MADNAAFEPVRRRSDHIVVPVRANEPSADAQASRPRPAGGLLRPSQVPVPGRPTSVTGSPSPGACFSTDFSQVPVHTAATARASAAEAGARAAFPAAQRRGASPTERGSTLAAQRDAVRAALRSQGRPLSPPVRADMEARLGADFADVRVHTDQAADRAARAVAAHAFTTGSHLVFGRGGYDTSSTEGRRLLAHELTHVMQQRRGPVAGTGGAVRISDPADRFEREAEATSRQAISGGRAGHGAVHPSGPPPGRHADGAQAHTPVQRVYTGKPTVGYGNLDPVSGAGTVMQAELHQGWLGGGSKPTVEPNWWPTAPPATVAWFTNYMVQGHLLNQKLGGPGNTMENLTPITKSTNSEHYNKAEKYVLAEVNAGNVVEYDVTVDYSTHPTGKQLVGNTGTQQIINDIDLNYANKLAGQIDADYTIYDSAGKDITKARIGTDKTRWEIKNEAK